LNCELQAKETAGFCPPFVSLDAQDKPGHDEEKRRLGPGSAAQHFVLRCARETRSIVEEAPQLP